MQTLCSAGIVALCFVIGNALERKANQWNCTGDMMTQYDMNLVYL